MKKLRFIYAIAALLCIGACDDDDTNDNTTNNLQKPDERFVEKIALGNMTEIEFGGMAVTRGQSEMVKDFGQHMVTSHSTAQQELRVIGDDFDNVNWPQELDAQHKQMKEQLMTLSGRAFDSAYMKSQVMDHEMTLMIFQNELDSGQNASVKAFANKYKPHIEEHLAKADSILNAIIMQPAAGN